MMKYFVMRIFRSTRLSVKMRKGYIGHRNVGNPCFKACRTLKVQPLRWWMFKGSCVWG